MSEQELTPDTVKAPLIRFVADELAFVKRTADPFLIEGCPGSQTGHYPIASCGEIVCVYCGEVFWR